MSLLILLCSLAFADAPIPALTVGVMELTTVDAPPDHLAFYGLVSLDFLFPIGDSRWTAILSTGIDFAPENNNFGLFCMGVADYRLNDLNDKIIWSLEPQAGMVHNAARLDSGIDHAIYPTAGLGVGIGTAHGTLLPTVTWSVGLKGEGLSMASMMMYSVIL